MHQRTSTIHILDECGRKIALVATAHWLLRCMFAMLRTQQPWREAS